jgi:ABC-type glycerol-3-phosphate transport system substrate-binding protein
MAKWTQGTAEQPAFLKVLGGFEKATGAKVTYTPAGDEIPTVLGTRIEGGKPPEVAILPQPGVFRDFAEKGSLLPLEDIVGNTIDADFQPVWRDLGSVDGKLYGVWFKSANKSTFWYDINVFNDAGVQPPGTWDELKSVANTINQFGLPAYAIDGDPGWVLSDWFENIYMNTAGPAMYDKLAKHEIPWTDPSVKKALTLFKNDIIGDGSNLLGGIDGTLQSEFPAALTQAFGKPPKAGMYYEADFVPGPARDAGAIPGKDVDYFDFPKISGEGGVVVGGDVAVMLKDTPAARALIQYLASPEAGEIWAHIGGFTSPNKQVDMSVYPDDIARRAAETVVNATSVAYDLSDQQPGEFGATEGQGIWGLLQDFLRHPDVNAITQQLEDAAKKAYS